MSECMVANQQRQRPSEPRVSQSKALKPRPKRRRKSNGWKRPPNAGGFSTKNSHTSARKIALRRLQAEALTLREQGYNYEQISEHMKRPMTTVYRWVSDAIEAIVQEPAERVLKLELQRLDAYLAAHHANAVSGDIPSTDMALKIIEKRCRLLGLFPETGKQQTLGVAVKVGDTAPDAISIEFVWPGPRVLDDELIEHRTERDVTPPQRPQSPHRAATEKAPQTIDATVNPPTSVPIIGKPRKPTDWMG
jgi:hypothetical protein